MAKIEIVFNDVSRLRGIFKDATRAATFFVHSISTGETNFYATRWKKPDADDYEKIQIIIDGTAFGPPGPPHIFLEPDYFMTTQRRVEHCEGHIKQCLEIKRSFFDT